MHLKREKTYAAIDKRAIRTMWTFDPYANLDSLLLGTDWSRPNLNETQPPNTT